MHDYYAQPIYYTYVGKWCESLTDWSIPLSVASHSRPYFSPFKCLHGLAPTYLSALLSPCCPTRSLRSSDQLLLNQPTSRTKIGERSFSCAAPRAWNQLPLAVRQCTSVNQFKVALKTHLFTDYYFDTL